MTLSPQQFPQWFHGTRHDIEGGWVEPADKVGKQVSEASLGDPGGLSGGNHAFAVRGDEGYAWHAAQEFHNQQIGRARVYEVHPTRDRYPGPWNPEHRDFRENVRARGYDPDEAGQDEWASPTGWKVKSRIDIKPGHQGTFPQVDWEKHAVRLWTLPRRTDFNHPTDETIAMGGEGALARKYLDRETERDLHGRLHRARELDEYAAEKGKPFRRVLGISEIPHDPHKGQGRLF